MHCFIFILHVWVFLPAYVSEHHRCQEKALELLELQLQMTVGHHVGARN